MQNGFNGQFFHIFEKNFFCFAVAIFDLVQDVEAISLGQPELFEKVAKIGVGVHIWLLQVSKLTHH